MLHRQLPGGAIGVDLASAVEVLLDVAYAVQYLHSMGLIHGDIKVGTAGAREAPGPACRSSAAAPRLTHAFAPNSSLEGISWPHN
jgi:serine/threonine protein kinase